MNAENSAIRCGALSPARVTTLATRQGVRYRSHVKGQHMTDEPKQRDPMPPVLWGLLGLVALCFLVLWGYGGFYRSVGWFGLLIGSIAVAVLSLWTRDSFGYESSFRMVADAVMRLSWVAAALIFLFGIVTTGTVVLGPVFSAIDPYVHMLGWIVLVGGALWLASKQTKDR